MHYFKTVSSEEQIMSKEKYPSLFSGQMEAIDIIRQIFFAARLVWKIGDNNYLSISNSRWSTSNHVTRLDQLSVNEY